MDGDHVSCDHHLLQTGVFPEDTILLLHYTILFHFSVLTCEYESAHISRPTTWGGAIGNCTAMMSHARAVFLDHNYSLRRCLEHMGGTYVDGASFGSVTALPDYSISRCVKTNRDDKMDLYHEFCCPGM